MLIDLASLPISTFHRCCSLRQSEEYFTPALRLEHFYFSCGSLLTASGSWFHARTRRWPVTLSECYSSSLSQSWECTGFSPIGGVGLLYLVYYVSLDLACSFFRYLLSENSVATRTSF